VAEQVAGASLADFWSAWISGTGELEYGDALDTYGLRFRAAAGSGRASLGVTTRNDAGRLVVTGTGRERAASADALVPDDEILAIEERRVRPDQLARRLDDYKPGDRVTVLIARRDQLLRVPVTLASQPPHRWEIEIDPVAGDLQRRRLASWLQSPP
jgi:predicted metalloprotease with PDZ domain